MAHMYAAAATATAMLGAGLSLLTTNGDVVGELSTRAGMLAGDAHQAVSDLASTAGTAALNQICGEPAQDPDAAALKEKHAQEIANAFGDGRKEGALGAAAAGGLALIGNYLSQPENRDAVCANMVAARNSITGACGAGMDMLRGAGDAWQERMANNALPEYGEQDPRAEFQAQREELYRVQTLLQAAQDELNVLRATQHDRDLPLGEARMDMLEQEPGAPALEPGSQEDTAPAVLTPMQRKKLMNKFKKFKVAELRQKCKQLRLPHAGKKEELVLRLYANGHLID